jgi:site-specific DNA-methyltransferase (adenine-specific)
LKKQKIELFNDHFQNYKRYAISKAQLVIADIPYNVGNNAYASSPAWYKNGDDSNGQSDKANSTFLIRMSILELQSSCTFVHTC